MCYSSGRFLGFVITGEARSKRRDLHDVEVERREKATRGDCFVMTFCLVMTFSIYNTIYKYATYVRTGKGLMMIPLF